MAMYIAQKRKQDTLHLQEILPFVKIRIRMYRELKISPKCGSQILITCQVTGYHNQSPAGTQVKTELLDRPDAMQINSIVKYKI